MNPILSYILSRVKERNQNFLCLIVGATGSGKTYASLKLCEALDPSFNISRVAFTPTEFMALVNDYEKVKNGSAIIFDEFGVSMSSRDSMSKVNKLLSYCVQTFRNRNLIVIFTVPSMSFIDKHVRSMIHALFVTSRIRRVSKEVILKPHFVKVNQYTGDYTLPYLTNDEGQKISVMAVSEPSKQLIDDYEIKKISFTKKLNKDILEEFDKEEGIMKGREMTDYQKQIYELNHKGLTQLEIATLMGVNISSINKCLNACRRKGFEIKLQRTIKAKLQIKEAEHD